MITQKEFFSYQRQSVCTVAIYGKEQADFFKGHLIFKTYYTDDKKIIPDTEKTCKYFLDTLFYETNKIIRSYHHEAYDERRQLVVHKFKRLGEPYRVVYNLYANPAPIGFDNGLEFLYEKDTNAKGLAIILKKNRFGELTALDEAEARSIICKLEQKGV